MRQIDADEAYKVLTDYYHHKTEIQHDALKEAIERVPTVDAEPVRHEHWKEHKDYPGLAYLCSGCGYFTTDRSYYCPYCGAKNEVEE